MLKYIRTLFWCNNKNGYDFLSTDHTKCFMVVTLIHPIFFLQGKSYCRRFSDENVKALKGTSGVGEGVLVQPLPRS